MKKFKRVYIEITNQCNRTCGFCPKTRRPPEFMGADLFRHILENIRGVSKYVYFHVKGEPLLHPRLGEFLSWCGELGYKVNLTTNGTLIEKAYPLIGNPGLRQVNISLHCNDDSGNTSSNQYLSRIFDFVDKAKDQTLICLRLWNLAGTGPHPGNREILEKITARYAPGTVVENSPTHVRGIQIGKNLFLNQANAFLWPDLNREDLGRDGFCYGLREQIAILADGTVVPCCLDKDGDLNLGNIKDDRLETIINGPRARAIYNGFSRRKAVEPLCRKCGYRTRFSGGLLK